MKTALGEWGIYYGPEDVGNWSSDTPHTSLSDILEEWKKYLKQLPRRQFSVWKDGCLYLNRTVNVKESRKVDLTWWDHDTHNTLERELHIRIAARKDTTLASRHQPLKQFISLLLRCAGSNTNRDSLKSLANKFTDLWISGLEDVTDEYEQTAQWIYNEFISTIWFENQEEEDSFLELSWENRERFNSYPYSCRCWLIQACIIDMINLEDNK